MTNQENLFLKIEGMSRQHTISLIDSLIAKGQIIKSKKEIIALLDKNDNTPEELNNNEEKSKERNIKSRRQ